MGLYAYEILGRGSAARGLLDVLIKPGAFENNSPMGAADAGELDRAARDEVTEGPGGNREVGGGFGQGHHGRRGMPEMVDLVRPLSVVGLLEVGH